MVDPALAVRTLPPCAVRWSAVFAGMAVGIALNLVLVVGGVALGLALHGPDRGALPVAAAAWNAIAMLVSAFVGGYVAARGARRFTHRPQRRPQPLDDEPTQPGLHDAPPVAHHIR